MLYVSIDILSIYGFIAFSSIYTYFILNGANISKNREKIVNWVYFLKCWQGIGSYGLRINNDVLEIMSLLSKNR